VSGAIGAAGTSTSGAAGNTPATGGAGSSTDPGVPSGTPDPNGPCKDLNLFCFDPFDMFILNPECFTCNNGMGCQACELFQAI
jgi:hypothetical protein